MEKVIKVLLVENEFHLIRGKKDFPKLEYAYSYEAD